MFRPHDPGPGWGLAFVGGLLVVVGWMGLVVSEDALTWGFGACFGWLLHETVILLTQWVSLRRVRRKLLEDEG